MLKLFTTLKKFLYLCFSPKYADKQVLFALQERPKYSLELALEIGCPLGQMYIILNTLEKADLIGSYWDETYREERAGARRRYYYLKK